MDTVDPLSEATIKTQLAEIAQFRTSRSKGHHWVTHQLKVLVSDEEEDGDTGDEQYETLNEGTDLAYDSDDSADMERYGIKLSLQGSGGRVKFLRPDATERVTSDAEVSQCPRCKTYPRFSQTRRTRRFRLVEPWKYSKDGDEFEACDHFVAVSYCWSSYEASPRTCQIRDCTGSRADAPRPRSDSKGKSRDDNVYLSIENGRVPFDEVLDRAVDFASSGGLRCIWIDQACLPQDESEEHQTGVQSMDMVYQRARHTVGLLGSSINSQNELDSIATFFAWRRSYARSGSLPGQEWWDLHFFKRDQYGVTRACNGHGMPKRAQTAVAKNVFRAMVILLQSIVDDKWYTRAWILQESVSAGPKLNLLLRVRPGLEYNPSSFMGQDARLISTNQQGGSTFILTLKELGELKHGLTNMLDELYGFDQSTSTDLGHGQDNGIISRAIDISALERIPRPHPLHISCGTIKCACKSGFVCNAACAIALLRGRHCLKPEDKAAILANLCNFEIRLDTFQLAKHFKSLRLCLIALALLNADLSLLVPQFCNFTPSIDDTVPLFQVAYLNLHNVNKFTIQPDNAPRVQAVSQPCLTPGGVILPAFLWCVDREVDFAPIRLKWAEQWWKLKRLRQPGTRVSTTWWRETDALDEPERQVAERILDNLRERYLEGDPLRDQQDDERPGVLFSASVPFELLLKNHRVGLMIGEIVRDILSYLLHSNEVELANSIWQSLRWAWYTKEGRRVFLPDKIDDILLKHCHFLQFLQLNYTPDAAFAQEWLFDRVVLRGKLWVGHYIPSGIKGSALGSIQPFNVVSNDVFGGQTRSYEHCAPPQVQPWEDSHSVAHTLQIVRDMMQNQGPEIRKLLDPWATRTRSYKDSSVIGRDFVKAFLYESLRFQWRSPEAFESSNNATILGTIAAGLSPSMQAFMHYTETYVGWDIEQQDLRVHRRVSAFDVDGPCIVATPLDAIRERIPHSEERTLSSCWVIEPKGTDVTDEEADWIRKEFIRFRRVVLGGPKVEDFREFSEMELEHVPEHVVDSLRALRLKVLRQVQGMWDIMDPDPFQSFLFS